MHTSHLGMVLAFVVLVSVINADWEVLNGGTSESRTDGDVDAFNLKQENLLPVDAVTKRELKTKQINLSSLDQNDTEKSHPTALKVKTAQKQDDASTAKSDSTKTEEGVKMMASQHASLSETAESPKSDDVINFAEEGLLSLEKKKNNNNVHSGRKLAQLKEQSSHDMALRNNQKQKSEKDSQNDKASLSKDDLALENFKVACVYENSWECLMFKEDFLAMQGDDNISRRATALERAKRQSAPAYGQAGAVKNHGNTRSLLLDCEDYSCISGDGNITDTVDESLDLQIKGRTRTRRPIEDNLPLNDTVREQLAKDLEKQLTEIFKDIPGFKNVTVNPKNIYYDTTTSIAYDGWVVHIDSSNNKYTNQTAPDVRKILTDALKDANGKYNNISVLGKPPLELFNFTKAIDDVVQQVSSPCEKTPSPCPYGYGQCRVLLSGEKNMTGINVECTDNCANYDSQCAAHGQCNKDGAGKAYCNCSQNWVGLYCDKANDTKANKDITASANYTAKLHFTFKTNLTSNDLTPAKRKELADTLSKKLNEIMKIVPGFLGITVDPNAIVFQDGKLFIPWEMKLNSAAMSEFTGKTTELISDGFKAALQSVSEIYRNTLLIDGLELLEGLDITNATDQVIAQANDPCSTNPCSTGYGNCEVLSPSQVKCIHNCNAHRGLCQNEGTCLLNSLGNASCECTSGWTGQNCESQASKKLDDGKIVGVAIGALLIAAGIIGAAIWFFLFANRNKDIGFTNYTDNEGSAGNSNAGKSTCVIDRPQVSPNKLPLFTQSGPNSRNFSRTSSYETPNSSAGSAGANPFSWA